MSVSENELIINDYISIPLSELKFRFVRSSGPGGQNVNKVNSQAQLFWDLSETEALPEVILKRFKDQQRGRISKENIFRLDGQQYRDREKNRLDCLDRLKELVVRATEVPKIRRKTRVSRGAKERRLKNKNIRSQTKQNRRRPGMDD